MRFKKNNGLIGFTGLVGQNIIKSGGHFSNNLYNSTNIKNIRGKDFDLLICAGARGNRRIANINPDEDKQNIDNLIYNLYFVNTKKLILISTIDVISDYNTPYAKHRGCLESFCIMNFDCLIIRLPIIFGIGTKKNIVYDFIHEQYNFVNKSNIFQFYDLANIWKDINLALSLNIDIINFVSEPIGANELAKEVFNVELQNTTEELRKYNILSKHLTHWNTGTNYLYTKEQIYNSIRYYKEKDLI